MATPEQAQTLRGRLMSADCPSRQVLRHVSSRWGLLVILALGEGGQMRFSELRSTIGGISERMLTETLRNLAEDGIVTRQDHHEVPPRVDYTLTPLGHGLAERVLGLGAWIEENIGEIVRAQRAIAAE